MLTTEIMPDWPPADGEVIGEERARDHVAWIREHVPPLLKEGERVLRDRFGDTGVTAVSARVDQIASWKLHPQSDRLNVGVLYCSIKSGAWAMMDINIRRDGRLELRPGWNMK